MYPHINLFMFRDRARGPRVPQRLRRRGRLQLRRLLGRVAASVDALEGAASRRGAAAARKLCRDSDFVRRWVASWPSGFRALGRTRLWVFPARAGRLRATAVATSASRRRRVSGDTTRQWRGASGTCGSSGWCARPSSRTRSSGVQPMPIKNQTYVQ